MQLPRDVSHVLNIGLTHAALRDPGARTMIVIVSATSSADAAAQRWRRVALGGPAMVARPILGIDIGGSGIKGALVDVAQGAFLSERLRLPTPQPARPEPVSRAVADLAQHFAWHGPIGCTFPAFIKGGVAAAAGESGYLPATREPLRNVHQPRYAGAAGAAARRSGSGIRAAA